ncbi:MAG TPA: peptidylprolyl isomerase [Candidatus Polarisedimenticolia bacterium]|nr:peptidylprolyl isomerase [Candidatus Polarisedimenticolia bacterium]
MNRLAPALMLVVFAHAACASPADQTAASPGAAEPAPVASAQEDAPAPAPTGTQGPVVARVNGVEILRIDFEQARANYMQTSGAPAQLTPEQQTDVDKAVLDGLIGTELLYQKARSIPIEIPQADVDAAIAQTRAGMGEENFKAEMSRRGMSEEGIAQVVRRNLMVQKMIQERVVGQVTVSEQESQTFYNENQQQMAKPETIKASHILVRSEPNDPAEKRDAARKKIEEARARLKSGEEFAGVARQYSEDGSAAQGGVLGEIPRGRTVPAFEQAAFNLPVGQTSDVVETEFGFHLIRVTARSPAGTASFDEVKGQIGEFLKQRKSQQAIETMVTSLRAEAKIEVL